MCTFVYCSVYSRGHSTIFHEILSVKIGPSPFGTTIALHILNSQALT